MLRASIILLRPSAFVGPKAVVCTLKIAYDTSMNKLCVCLTFFLLLTLPGNALNYAALERAVTSPVDEPVFSIYTSSAEVNSRRAVRLGYQNFHTRLNTPNMTPTDTQIALLITTGFQPFFNKLNQLESASEQERQTRSPALQNEFENLVRQLAVLLFKNQRRYMNPFFLQEKSALEETLKIVQEAIERGSF